MDFIVAFLGEVSTESRFIGVYKNHGKIEENNSIGASIYDLSEAVGFDILKEKVIIDWGKSAVSWHQYFSNVKEVLRIEKGLQDLNGIPYFKSYSDINISFEELTNIIKNEPEDWKVALQAVNAIYMIIDKHNGKQYIGSTYAKGIRSGGIWNRWLAYVQTGGHAENRSLKEILDEKGMDYARHFSWIVLETLPLRITDKEVIARENVYKEKFLTRIFGYNNN